MIIHFYKGTFTRTKIFCSFLVCLFFECGSVLKDMCPLPKIIRVVTKKTDETHVSMVVVFILLLDSRRGLNFRTCDQVMLWDTIKRLALSYQIRPSTAPLGSLPNAKLFQSISDFETFRSNRIF